VDILRVQEINRPVEITQVPEAPDFVRGIINLRGNVIPVVSLRKRFGMVVKDDDKQSRIVVVEMGGTIIGFMVDSVSEVLRIPMSTIEPPPSIITSVDSDYISGVGKLEDRLIILLNLDEIMTAKDIEKIKQAA
jgi:purine-binding chemotaxis protein CheW